MLHATISNSGSFLQNESLRTIQNLPLWMMNGFNLPMQSWPPCSYLKPLPFIMSNSREGIEVTNKITEPRYQRAVPGSSRDAQMSKLPSVASIRVAVDFMRIYGRPLEFQNLQKLRTTLYNVQEKMSTPLKFKRCFLCPFRVGHTSGDDLHWQLSVLCSLNAFLS